MMSRSCLIRWATKIGRNRRNDHSAVDFMDMDWGQDINDWFAGCTPECIHRARSPFQADLFRVKRDGHEYVVKDFSRRPFIIRKLLLRACVRHEYATMRKLEGVKGTPGVYALSTADVLVMDFMPNTGTLPDHGDPDADFPPPVFFAKFRALVDQMHGAGVAHGDIRRRNLLVGENGPVLIDFGTAISRNGMLRLVRRRLFRMLARTDVRKALQFQDLYVPGSLTKEEEKTLHRRMPLLVMGRWIRRNIYRKYFKRRGHLRRASRATLPPEKAPLADRDGRAPK